jgi:hypothetical protein
MRPNDTNMVERAESAPDVTPVSAVVADAIAEIRR